MPLWSHFSADLWSCFVFQKVAGFEALNFDHYWLVLTDRWQNEERGS
jgi:hypothetical protein